MFSAELRFSQRVYTYVVKNMTCNVTNDKEICQSLENRNEHARNTKDSCNLVLGDSTVENAVVFGYCLFTCFQLS